MEKLITIKMKNGKSRKQRVKVLASGKFKFIKNKARSAGSRIKSKVKRRTSNGKRKSNKQPNRSKGSRKMGSKQGFLSKAYPKKDVKIIAAKTAIGVAAGLAIRLSTMFMKQPRLREVGIRAASTSAAYLGGGTGELAYQALDAGLSRLIIAQRNGNGNGGFGASTLLVGGA